MKTIRQLNEWQEASLQDLTAGTNLYMKLLRFEVELGEVLRLLKEKWDEAEFVYRNQGARTFYDYYVENK